MVERSPKITHKGMLGWASQRLYWAPPLFGHPATSEDKNSDSQPTRGPQARIRRISLEIENAKKCADRFTSKT